MHLLKSKFLHLRFQTLLVCFLLGFSFYPPPLHAEISEIAQDIKNCRSETNSSSCFKALAKKAQDKKLIAQAIRLYFLAGESETAETLEKSLIASFNKKSRKCLPMQESAHGTQLCTDPDGNRWVVKSSADDYPMKKASFSSPYGEVLVYEISKKLGLSIVPLTIEFEENGLKKSAQIFIEEGRNGMIPLQTSGDWERAQSLNAIFENPDLLSFLILDFITGQADRHSQNSYQWEGLLFAIDNSIVFQADNPGYSYIRKKEGRGLQSLHVDGFVQKMIAKTTKNYSDELKADIVKMLKTRKAPDPFIAYFEIAFDRLRKWTSGAEKRVMSPDLDGSIQCVSPFLESDGGAPFGTS